MKKRAITIVLLLPILLCGCGAVRHVGRGAKASVKWGGNQLHCLNNNTPSRWNASCPAAFGPEQRGPVKPYWLEK